MKTIRQYFIASLAMAALFTLLGCTLAGHWQLGMFFVVLSGGWWLQQLRGMRWHTPLFIVYMGALVLIGILDVGAGWLLFAAVAVLISWDLNLFLHQADKGNLVNELLLVQVHLRALGRVAVLALLLGGVVLLIQIQLSFWTAFVLALVIILALNGMMRQIAEE
jgi:hypothetical protein